MRIARGSSCRRARSSDATYLALAEALPDPLLITGDGGLASAARTLLGGHAVHELG